MSVFIAVFLMVTSSLASASEPVDDLLEKLNVKAFTGMIKQIKSFDDIAQIDEVDYGLKPFYKDIKFWYFFD